MLVNLCGGVNDALHSFSKFYKDTRFWETKDTRGGKVKVLAVPYTTAYGEPRARVLRDPDRDANPFFHLFEALWMLGGRHDVEFLKQFNSTIDQFSDDGAILHGAYGYRWRHHFGYDQLEKVIEEIKKLPNTRRAVLSMWDAHVDPGIAAAGGRDVPCNTQVYFSIKNDQLDMTVTCRSNDAIWGCYGANAVHMSMLLEYTSLSTFIPMGRYYQMSNDLHVYERHWPLMAKFIEKDFIEDPYENGKWKFSPKLWIGGGKKAFDDDLERFLTNPYQIDYTTQFMREIVAPMAIAFQSYKGGDIPMALDYLDRFGKYDWLNAAREWLERRVK